MYHALMLALATNGGLGYARKAPGTFGTLAGIPAFYLLARTSPAISVAFWLLILLLSFHCADYAGRHFGVVDDGRIVIDELIGYLTTVLFLPFSWQAAMLGFLLFRFFDIVKIFPASWFDQKLKNGYGVVLDDVFAGIYAALVLRVLLKLLH
ncbi:MAG: phosphatidylglycerophosphatase A [Desulfuromonadaceae bacterium]|nr:phosphatidylglycerophosphatase A [Desulfuromonadaceae bacterium]